MLQVSARLLIVSASKVVPLLCVMLFALACANPALEHVQQGTAYREQGKFDEAIAEYTMAIEIDPDLAVAYNNRGCAYSWKKDYENAVADLSKAIELDPNEVSSYLNRALLYIANDEEDKAIVDLKKVIELAEDPSVIQGAEQLLEMVTAGPSL